MVAILGKDDTLYLISITFILEADIYSFGASADYVAKNLLKNLQGEYLWGTGEITPAMAVAVGQSNARKLLLPVNHCNNMVAGVKDLPLSRLMDEAVELLASLCK